MLQDGQTGYSRKGGQPLQASRPGDVTHFERTDHTLLGPRQQMRAKIHTHVLPNRFMRLQEATQAPLATTNVKQPRTRLWQMAKQRVKSGLRSRPAAGKRPG
jgi:hypothetical protein